MKIIHRICSAAKAFIEPELVSEALGMRAELMDMYVDDSVSIIRSGICGRYLVPHIFHIPHHKQAEVLKCVHG